MSEDSRYVTIVSHSDVEDEVLRFTVNGAPLILKSNVAHWLSEEEIGVIESAGWDVVDVEED